jgi:hypothetical protein
MQYVTDYDGAILNKFSIEKRRRGHFRHQYLPGTIAVTFPIAQAERRL